MMKVYNSLTFQMEEFKTIHPNEVLMYVCGPTVYDSPHLGHAKSAVAFDVIRRYLEFKGYHIKVVKNYTDIDDKIIKRANEKGIDFETLSEQHIEEYERIMKSLNLKPDEVNPRATEIIDYMIEVIESLINKGYAYESNGSVYFSVRSYEGYEEIFQNIKKGEDEEEYEIPEEEEPLYGDKYDPKDFVLWKAWKEGEPYWESPWGRGRPGWHIECSCMAIKYLGDVIDVHGGGLDLKAPHHKNEIVQTTAYTGKQRFANYFFHNGFVKIDDEKMSKSLGNFFLVSEILEKFDPMVVRFFLISSHYRRSINFTLDNMKQSEKNYNKLINTIRRIDTTETIENGSSEVQELLKMVEETEGRIIDAMDEDFNTPEAIAEILALFKDLNRIIFEEKTKITEDFKDAFFNFISDLDSILGIFPKLKKKLKLGIAGSIDEKDELIKNLINIIRDTREALRERKLYDLSDNIRDKLRELNINVEDK
ncbi:MAG: cysteine--tRNA ligase [Candidatus Lokiarchaeota archaeon]|nr:cysteine--tRNA ligase [Candidatus Lokiarchaeota archaeon]MBD3201529.1 cysteine--tRNA ligase [Candidatus Lokiarchaeota archaeon]